MVEKHPKAPSDTDPRPGDVPSRPGFHTLQAGTAAQDEPAVLGGTLLDIPEVAQRLSVSTKTVRRLIARGELPIYRIGRLLRISSSDYDIYVATRRQK